MINKAIQFIIKNVALLTIVIINTTITSAQRIVYHTDLPKTLMDNSAFKIGMTTSYGAIMNNIVEARKSMSENMAIVVMVQNKVYASLSQADDLIRNGRYIYYIALKVPKIATNIVKAGNLIADKPYLLAYWKNTGELITSRVIALQQYIQDFVLKNNKDVLIDQVKRDQFIYRTYRDITTIYNLTEAMVQQFQLYKLTDAINSVVPYKWYVNLDKSIVTDILNKTKF